MKNKNNIVIVDQKFKDNKLHYVIQCFIASVCVFAMIHFIDELMHGLIIGCFGASSFIAFAMPHLYTGHPRRLVGGYIASIIVAVIVLFIMHYFPYDNKLLFASITFGLTALLMTMFNAEHPPAVGFAMGIVLYEYSINTVLAIFIGVIIIAALKHILRNWLVDLM